MKTGAPAALIWIPRIFAVVGVGLILLASWFFMDERRFIAAATRTTGTVVEVIPESDSDGDTHYFPRISFTAANGDSVTFRSRTGRNPPAYAVGDTVTVYYPAESPDRARKAGFFSLYGTTFILSILGAIFSAIGFVWLGIHRKARLLEEELRRFGRRIQARVTGIERNMNVSVNRRHPWIIVAEHEGQRYESPNLWQDPTGSVPETVDVLVDPQNPQRYLVDL